jgi:hypothetical protein
MLLVVSQARTFKNIITSLIPQIKLGLAQVEKEEAFKSKAKAASEGVEGGEGLDIEAEAASEVLEGGEASGESKRSKGVTAYLWAVIMCSSLKNDISEFVELAVIMLIMPVTSVQK